MLRLSRWVMPYRGGVTSSQTMKVLYENIKHKTRLFLLHLSHVSELKRGI